MRTLKDIKEMLVKCGAAIWGTKKEVKELPNIISDDEIITYATSGVYDGHTWLVISTDKGMFFGVNQIEIPLSKVNSIKYRKRFFLGEIEIWDGASMIKVTNILKKTLVPFVNAVNDSIEEFENLKKNQTSVADELIKFKKLLDEGVINRVEFDKKKKELLK